MDPTQWTQHEVHFEATGDLGIGVRVEPDGSVVVSKLKQIRGYGELSCPSLRAGDILVAVDGEPVVDLDFSGTMARLHATMASRPTTLEFLRPASYENAAVAVTQWREQQRDENRFHDGEFDVMFQAHQPTGLRFKESYLMTHPLKLAYVEPAIFIALGLRGQDRKNAREALLGTVLVRIDGDAVLDAPVDDVMSLLYDAESFPKQLWLAHPERLRDDYVVLTLTDRDQLTYLCFVPEEMMMEVPAVSYAAIGTSSTGGETTVVTGPGQPPKSCRHDGICEEQYLMAINGLPTLRLSAASFCDEGNGRETDDLVGVITKSLDQLVGRSRTLRFRDLKEYRREFLAHEPLSPWQRRRRRTSSGATTSDPTTSVCSEIPTIEVTPSSTSALQPLLVENCTASEIKGTFATSLRMEHRPRNFFRLLVESADQDLKECGSNNDHESNDCYEQIDEERELSQAAPPHDEGHSRKDTTINGGQGRDVAYPFDTPYHGLEDCEGTRSSTRPTQENVRIVTVPDTQRPVGIQLETDVLTKCTVFKKFLRQDGPSQSRQDGVRPGDVLQSINGVSVDEIPTDLLVKVLQGRETGESLFAKPVADTTISKENIDITRRIQFARRKSTRRHSSLFGSRR